jgi:hypothetical protein
VEGIKTEILVTIIKSSIQTFRSNPASELVFLRIAEDTPGCAIGSARWAPRWTLVQILLPGKKFLSAIEGNSINITDTNFTELDRSCTEFGFSELAAKLSDFRRSIDFKKKKQKMRMHADELQRLEKRQINTPTSLRFLEDKVTELSTDFGHLVGEVSALRSASAGVQTLSEEVSALKTQIGQKTERSNCETTFNEIHRTSKRSFDSEIANCSDVTHCHSISESTASSIARFADYFRLSEDLRRVPKEAVFHSVAGQSRWFQSTRISPPM